MRFFAMLSLALALGWPTPAAGDAGALPAFPLRVSANHRQLEDVAGRPFLYTADTPWHLFMRLNREETERYLADRAHRGFTAIQVQLVPEGTGAATTNRFGERPFLTPFDLATPNEKYFTHVEWVLKRAEAHGLLVTLNPAWLGGGEGGWRDVLKTNGVANCRAYGEFLGARFRPHPNLLWLDGGDRDPGLWLPFVRALAEGLKSRAPG